MSALDQRGPTPRLRLGDDNFWKETARSNDAAADGEEPGQEPSIPPNLHLSLLPQVLSPNCPRFSALTAPGSQP